MSIASRTLEQPIWVAAGSIAELLPVQDCADVLKHALLSGLDPSIDPPRVNLDTRAGQLLLMPSELGEHVGVKVVGLAPGNSERGLALVQGVYVLVDASTLATIALLDGPGVTSLRTPAVSVLAARYLAPSDARTLVVFGAGTQARQHIFALSATLPLREVIVVGRDYERTAALVADVRANGIDASMGGVDAAARADIIVCATTSVVPLFDGTTVDPRCLVIAVGAYEANAREIDSALMGAAQVVVEDRQVALREAGDVVLAIVDGALAADTLVGLADVVRGQITVDRNRPRVFKSVGMSWQDLVTASEVYRRCLVADRLPNAAHR